MDFEGLEACVDMDQWERNQARINKVGSSDNPPSEETPLGTLIEEEPKWECCCCDQAIPRPGGGYSTAVGSFCSQCFLEFLEYLFNRTPSRFLNEIRQESGRFGCHPVGDVAVEEAARRAAEMHSQRHHRRLIDEGAGAEVYDGAGYLECSAVEVQGAASGCHSRD